MFRVRVPLNEEENLQNISSPSDSIQKQKRTIAEFHTLGGFWRTR
jgi:hypothetical protein